MPGRQDVQRTLYATERKLEDESVVLHLQRWIMLPLLPKKGREVGLKKKAVPTSVSYQIGGCVLSGTKVIVMRGCPTGTVCKEQQVGKKFQGFLLRHESMVQASE
jgi:hypothetical protein